MAEMTNDYMPEEKTVWLVSHHYGEEVGIYEIEEDADRHVSMWGGMKRRMVMNAYMAALRGGPGAWAVSIARDGRVLRTLTGRDAAATYGRSTLGVYKDGKEEVAWINGEYWPDPLPDHQPVRSFAIFFVLAWSGEEAERIANERREKVIANKQWPMRIESSRFTHQTYDITGAWEEE